MWTHCPTNKIKSLKFLCTLKGAQMKAKLTINNQELEVDISEEELEKLKPKKDTGYAQEDQLQNGTAYYCVDIHGWVTHISQCYNKKYYENANLYSDKQTAIDDARADKLMRQLRRYAAINPDDDGNRYTITYMGCDIITASKYESFFNVGQIFFKSVTVCREAIDKYYDELLWYFKEYLSERI